MVFIYYFGLKLFDDIHTYIYIFFLYNIALLCKYITVKKFKSKVINKDYEKQKTEDDISVVTLKREANNTYSRVLSGREVAQNREDFGFEVRL